MVPYATAVVSRWSLRSINVDGTHPATHVVIFGIFAYVSAAVRFQPSDDGERFVDGLWLLLECTYSQVGIIKTVRVSVSGNAFIQITRLSRITNCHQSFYVMAD